MPSRRTLMLFWAYTRVEKSLYTTERSQLLLRCRGRQYGPVGCRGVAVGAGPVSSKEEIVLEVFAFPFAVPLSAVEEPRKVELDVLPGV